MFMKYFNHIAPDIEIDTFLIAFLHELGHHMTCDEISAEDELYCLEKRTLLDYRINLNLMIHNNLL